MLHQKTRSKYSAKVYAQQILPNGVGAQNNRITVNVFDFDEELGFFLAL